MTQWLHALQNDMVDGACSFDCCVKIWEEGRLPRWSILDCRPESKLKLGLAVALHVDSSSYIELYLDLDQDVKPT